MLPVNRTLDNVDFSTAPTPSANFPRVLHFMPDCNANSSSWTSQNPTYRVISWTQAELDKLISMEIKTLPTLSKDDRTILNTIVVLNHIGGVVVAAPYACKCNIEHITTKTSLSTLIFGEDHACDLSLLVAKQSSKLIKTVLSHFTREDSHPSLRPLINKLCVSTSYDTAVYSTFTCSKIVQRNYLSYTHMFNTSLADSVHNRTIAELPVDCTADAAAIHQVCIQNGAIASSSAPYGLVIMDDDLSENSVQTSISFASKVVSILPSCQPKALLIITHSPAEGIGLDTFSAPYLRSIGATELHRSAFAVWQLAPAPA